MTDSLTLFIHYGDSKVDRVIVDPRSTIQSLEDFLPLPKHRFVFLNNCLLIGSFTFSFYKVSNGDHLFCVPIAFSIAKTLQDKLSTNIGLKNGLLSKFISSQGEKNLDAESASEKRISTFIRETARIKDNFFQKVEGTMLSHRKTFEKFASILIPKSNNEEKQHVTVIPPPCIKPSTETLPNIWNVENIDEYEYDSSKELSDE